MNEMNNKSFSIDNHSIKQIYVDIENILKNNFEILNKNEFQNKNLFNQPKL